eukprot:scaffold2834_cov103-Skeletonema_dohrnii-CCMP3373.AAC.2
MSRESALRSTLQLPDDLSLHVISVPPSGDCFYDCINALLNKSDASVSSYLPSESPLIAGLKVKCNDDDSTTITPEEMREYVADQLSVEQFDLYKMFAAANVEDYAWMSLPNSPQSLEELKQFARITGKDAGAGNCLWADEFALSTISDGLRVTLLIIDDQASRGGGRRQKRSAANNESSDGRFISIGDYPHCVVLHRTRRQHYNAVVVDDCPVMAVGKLPASFQSLWRKTTYGSGCSGGSVSVPLKPSSNAAMLKKESKQVDSTATKRKATSLAASEPSLGRFYVGCAGFTSSSWVGNFYPKAIVGNNSDRQIDHYQQHFSTVEINSTFYGTPSESTVAKWKQQFAKSFKLVVKSPKWLTHERSELDCSVLSPFMERMQPLGGILACILIQCPRRVAVDVSQLEQLRQQLQDDSCCWYKGRIAIELRNDISYNDRSVRDFILSNTNWTLVMHPDSIGRATVGTTVSGRGNDLLGSYIPEKLTKVAETALSAEQRSGFVYVRLHGSNDEHRGDYSMEDLQNAAEQISSWRTKGLDVFCFILNDMEPLNTKATAKPHEKWCAMPKNAKQLELAVHKISKDDAPKPPKKPKATLLNFFGKK